MIGELNPIRWHARRGQVRQARLGTHAPLLEAEHQVEVGPK